MIIDFHTHTFPKSVSLRAMQSMSTNGHVAFFADPTVENLAENMKRSGVDMAVNHPVMTRADQVSKVNDSMIRQKEEMEKLGIVTFGGMHPDFEDFRGEIQKLKDAGIRGVKFHPAFQGVQLNDIRYKRVISAISEAGMITLLHCGMDVGFMDHNFATVSDILELLRDVQPEKLVLAHMGGWQCWTEVESDLAGAPVWLDTAYSLGPVHLLKGEEHFIPYKWNLSSEDFTRLVRKHGTDHVLFATDFPWTEQSAYIRAINDTELTDDEKERIFSGNALRLIDLSV